MFRAGGPRRLPVAGRRVPPRRGRGSTSGRAWCTASVSGDLPLDEVAVSYFDTPTTERLWTRLAAFLTPFAADVYLSDLHLGSRMGGAAMAVFRRMLQVFARGRTHLHFADEQDVAPALAKHGFVRTVVHRPADWASTLDLPGVGGLETVQVLEASTRR